MKKTHPYLIILTLGLLFSSCVSTKKMIYFQPLEKGSIANDSLVSFEPTIGVGDLLSIHVSALDPQAARAFNLVENEQNGTTSASSYLVNSIGEIHFPGLGNQKVLGLTSKQLTDSLVLQLSDYIIKPVVNLRLVNFKVTVLGEVKQPGTYPVENERISVLEALGMAGDLTIKGKRTNVLLVREQDGKRQIVPIDLTSIELFNSPYYYLAQNDVIYVAPNKAKLNSSAVGPNIGIIFGSISTLLSIIVFLTN